MKHYPIHKTHPCHGSARTVALMSLFFSLLACVLAGVALLVATNGGHLPQSDLLTRRAPDGGAEAAPALPQAAGAGDATAQWNKVRDRLRQAETMVARRDGHAQEYLDSLRADMDRLRRNSADGGGKWMSDAVAKVKAIREQVAVNGPEAARRLRELSADLSEKVRTLYRAAEALQSIMPKKQGASAPAAGATETAPDVPEVPQTR